MLLRVDGITRRYLKNYREPSATVVNAYSESNKSINFSVPNQYCYSLEAPFDHPFNVAARDAFTKHFTLTLTKTNWLYKYPFDPKLNLPEIVHEVLRIFLVRAKKAWDSRRTFVKPNSEEKKKKRIDARRYTVCTFPSHMRHRYKHSNSPETGAEKLQQCRTIKS